MNVSLSDLNALAIVVSALVYFFIGSIWYSPVLFAAAWMKEIGKNREEMSMNPFLYVAGFLLTLIASFGLACVFSIADVGGFLTGLAAGFMAGVALAAAMALNFMYESKSYKLYLITVGYHLVSFPLMGMILALWK